MYVLGTAALLTLERLIDSLQGVGHSFFNNHSWTSIFCGHINDAKAHTTPNFLLTRQALPAEEKLRRNSQHGCCDMRKKEINQTELLKAMYNLSLRNHRCLVRQSTKRFISIARCLFAVILINGMLQLPSPLVAVAATSENANEEMLCTILPNGEEECEAVYFDPEFGEVYDEDGHYDEVELELEENQDASSARECTDQDNQCSSWAKNGDCGEILKWSLEFFRKVGISHILPHFDFRDQSWIYEIPMPSILRNM